MPLSLSVEATRIQGTNMRKKSKSAAPPSKEIVDQLDAIIDYCDPSDYGSLSPDEKARWDKQISYFNPDYRIPIAFPKPFMVRQRIDDLTSKWQRIDDCQLFIPALNDYLDSLRADLVALGLRVYPGDTLRLPTCYELAKIRDNRELADLWRSFIRVMGIFRTEVPEDDPEDRPLLNFVPVSQLHLIPTANELLWHADRIEKFAKALPHLNRITGRMRVDEYLYLDRDHPRRKNQKQDYDGQRNVNVIYTAVARSEPVNTALADALLTASRTLGAFMDNDFKGTFSKENAEKLLWAAEIIREQAASLSNVNSTLTPPTTSEKDLLNERDMAILQTLLQHKVFHSDKRMPLPEIVLYASGSDADWVSYKPVNAKLKRLDLIDTKEGRGGGSWLTKSGIERAEKL